MQIAVLSDLHLGRHDALDRFSRGKQERADDLVARVGKLEKSVDRIVLLGDIFETLRTSLPMLWAGELRRVLAAHPAFAKKLDDPRYVYVYGNHDVVASSVLGAAGEHTLQADGLKVLFFHGHQLDPLAFGPAPVSRAGVFVGGWIERAGLPFTQWKDRPSEHRPTKGPTLHDKLAAAVGRARGFDVVVNGHTHEAGSHEVLSTVVMNSGTWAAGRREFLLLDTRAKTFDVVVDA